jgi:hypothetical protein
MVLTYDALARDITVEHVLHRLLSTVPATRVSPRTPAPSVQSVFES